MNCRIANGLGATALVCWSMNIAVTRHLAEAHPFGMPGLSFFLSGLLLIAFDLLRGKAPPWNSDASPKFWYWGGGAFVAYVLLYTSGLSHASSRAVALPLGLVNYFWPSLILVLMPLFSACVVRWGILVSGMACCVAGVGCAFLWGASFQDLARVVRGNWPAFVMMLFAAFLWAFYSNAVRKWGGTANGTGWFQMTGGVCFLALWLGSGEPIGFTAGMLLPLLLHALVVNALAYLCWDYGVRWGDIGLMGTLANFLPIASVVFGLWYLGDQATPGLWLGAALVTCGAVLCRRGMAE